MCPPTHYDIKYEINPWMHTDNPINHEKATAEFAALKKTYGELGVEIIEISQAPNLPDMVYAANIGHPHGKMFVKSNFKYKERREEAEIGRKYFEQLGFAIKELPSDIIWEGQGDLLVAGDKYILGWGKRTMQEAKKYLSEYLNSDIIDLQLIDPYFYHLDMCLFPLDEKTVAVNPTSFTPDGLKKIYDSFENVIEVGEGDNHNMACNGVVVGKTLVTPDGISEQLKNAFTKYGFTTREIDMTEFKKGGGAAKCLTLEFY